MSDWKRFDKVLPEDERVVEVAKLQCARSNPIRWAGEAFDWTHWRYYEPPEPPRPALPEGCEWVGLSTVRRGTLALYLEGDSLVVDDGCLRECVPLVVPLAVIDALRELEAK